MDEDWGEPSREPQENTGGMRRKNKGLGEQQLKEEEGRGRKTHTE